MMKIEKRYAVCALVGAVVIFGCSSNSSPSPVPSACDFDGNGAVFDQADKDLLSAAQGARSGDPDFVEAMDLDGDTVISLQDTVICLHLNN